MKNISIALFQRMILDFLLFSMVVTSVTLTAVAGWSTISTVCALFFLILFIIFNRSFYFVKILTLPIFFIVYNFLTLLWGGDTVSALQITMSALAGVAVFIGLRKKIISYEMLVLAFIVGGLLNIWAMRNELVLFSGANSDEDRVAGLIGNANALALFLSFTAFSAFYIPLKNAKIMKLIAMIFIAFTILFTGSRKGLLIVIMSLIYGVWAYFSSARNSIIKILWGVFALAILVTGAILFFMKTAFDINTISVFERTQNMFNGEHNIRYDMIAVGFNLWKNNPIWGWGAGQFSNLTVFRMYSHNNYIETLSNYGLVGFFLYYGFNALLLQKGVAAFIKTGAIQARVGLMIVIMFLILEWGCVTLDEKLFWIFLMMAAALIFDGEEISKGVNKF